MIREPADEQDMGRLSYRISRVSRVNRVRACNSVGAVKAVTEGEDEGEKEVERNERDLILVPCYVNSLLLTANIQAWGGLITAENVSIPNMPRLEILNQ